MKLTNRSRNPFVVARTQPGEQEILLGRNETTSLDDERFQRLRRTSVFAVLLDRRLLVATRDTPQIDAQEPGEKVSQAEKPQELDVSNTDVDTGKRAVAVDSTPTRIEVPLNKVRDPDAPAGGRRRGG